MTFNTERPLESVTEVTNDEKGIVVVGKVSPGNARLTSVLEIDRLLGPLRKNSPGVVTVLVVLITSVRT